MGHAALNESLLGAAAAAEVSSKVRNVVVVDVDVDIDIDDVDIMISPPGSRGSLAPSCPDGVVHLQPSPMLARCLGRFDRLGHGAGGCSNFGGAIRWYGCHGVALFVMVLCVW